MTTPAQPDEPADVRAGSLFDPLDQGLAVASEIDVVPGDPPVPISVWRVAGTGHPARLDTGSGLTPPLAALLIGLYTSRGDTVVDLTSDPSIDGAAGAGARRYLPVNDPAHLADLDHVAGTVRLVVLRWPPTRAGRRTNVDPAGTEEPELTALLTACRLLLAADGYTIVALIPAPHAGYVEHAGRLISAARRAGLGYLQHIVAVTAPIPGAPAPRLAVPADPATLRAATHLRFHLDLLVFVLHRTGWAAGPAR